MVASGVAAAVEEIGSVGSERTWDHQVLSGYCFCHPCRRFEGLRMSHSGDYPRRAEKRDREPTKWE